MGDPEGTVSVDRDSPGTGHRHARLIAVSARLGVWGLVVALASPFAQALEGPFWLQNAMWLMSAGLLTSGVGTVAASVLVLRTLPPGSSPLKVAAFAGIPLGVLIGCLGGAVLAPLSGFADVVSASGPLALLLGVLVVVSLLVGFLQRGKA